MDRHTPKHQRRVFRGVSQALTQDASILKESASLLRPTVGLLLRKTACLAQSAPN